jgi:hypothetical protein
VTAKWVDKSLATNGVTQRSCVHGQTIFHS